VISATRCNNIRRRNCGERKYQKLSTFSRDGYRNSCIRSAESLASSSLHTSIMTSLTTSLMTSQADQPLNAGHSTVQYRSRRSTGQKTNGSVDDDVIDDVTTVTSVPATRHRSCDLASLARTTFRGVLGREPSGIPGPLAASPAQRPRA
jgi:hypothetical protein